MLGVSCYQVSIFPGQGHLIEDNVLGVWKYFFCFRPSKHDAPFRDCVKDSINLDGRQSKTRPMKHVQVFLEYLFIV